MSSRGSNHRAKNDTEISFEGDFGHQDGHPLDDDYCSRFVK